MNIVPALDARSYGFECKKSSLAGDQNYMSYFNLSLGRFQCKFADEVPVIGTDEASGLDCEVPPFASKFCSVPNQEHILAMANEEGEVSVINTNKRREDCYIKRITAHDNAVFDIAWAPADTSLVSGAGDQTAKLWDVPRGALLATFKGHSSSIKSVDFRPHDKSVFATGSRDGNIMIWDTRCNAKGNNISAENIIRNAHGLVSTTPRNKKKLKGNNQDTQQSVTVVLFQDENTLFSSGATDGMIKVWDLRKNYINYKVDSLPKYKIPYAGKSKKLNGYSSMVLDSSRRRLFASCTDNVIYQFDTFTFNLVSEYTGHENSTFYVRTALSPQDQYLLSGSSDFNAYVWQITNPGQPVFRLTGHDAEVTSVAWCPSDFNKLVTCSDDLRMRIWRPACEDPTADKQTENEVRGKVESLAVPCTFKKRKQHTFAAVECLQNTVKPKERTETTPASMRAETNPVSIASFCSPLNSTSNKNTALTTPARSKRKLYDENQENMQTNSSKYIELSIKTSENDLSKIPGQSISPKSVLSPSKQNDENQVNLCKDSINKNNESPVVKRRIFESQSHTSSESRDDLERHNVCDVAASPNVVERSSSFFSPNCKSSPTQNLPNFVLTGYQGNQCTTPVRTPTSRKVDWLTALRQKKSTPCSESQVTPKSSSASKVNRRLSICRNSDDLTPEKRLHISPKRIISPKISPGNSKKQMKSITNYFK